MPYANAIQENDDSFSGYRWSYFSSLGEGPLFLRAQEFHQSGKPGWYSKVVETFLDETEYQ